VNSVAFSHDGSMLATTGDDGALCVWDPRTGTELQSVDHGDGIVVAPAFSPDDRLVAAAWESDGDGDGGNFVEIRDVASGRVVQRLGPFLSVRSAGISFSPDGRRIVMPTAGATIVADVRTGDEPLSLTVGDDDIATDADWSPDGRWIATSHGDGTVRVFDAETGTQLYRLFAHRTRIWSMDWSPDSTRLATAGADGTAKVWEISDEGARGSLTLNDRDGSGVIGLAFSAEGDRLMTGDLEVTTVRIWDVSLGGDAEWSNVPLSHDVGVAFTEEGSQLVTSGGDEAWLWDLGTGDRTGTLAADRPTDPRPLHRIEVAPDGTIASAGIDVGVWRPDGRFVVGFDGRQWFDEVDWSGDGRFLAMRDQRTTTLVDRSWDVFAEFPGERGFIDNAVALSADGSLLAVASERMRRPDPTTAKVTIWDVARGEVLREIPAFGHDVAFDPTGTRIAAASVYGVADVWDVRSGEHLASLSGHAGEVTAVRFSPDGSVLATGGSDGTVRTWDPASGAPLLVLEGHASEVVRLAFDPDGSRLASSGNEGVARVWALDLDDLIEIARGELTRGFTDDECRRYLHLGACPSA
jgi:WD40 repeat protein